ncbi:hypothetical protein GY21_19620 [Cryobacterium roopkundense]|uniref:PE domain-containing protein n=1 Tax=Cryobacterium roopkundense TaxID=1001240 RepID=A0A099J0N3_9MICO|nr:DUF6507 family protein [Cryobacterium roopkundense]KGJ71821.1 hypothetical protein GY21_19620 [Cryobacterium roopkundense]MBB5640655.1 hypothetical protein [Cryobacterium roopkundense]
MGAGDGRWSIDIAATQHILAAVDATIEDFDTDARRLSEAIRAASETAGASKTGAALVNVVNELLMSEIVAAKTHAMNASTQTSAAVNAYIQGDLEMAQNMTTTMDP